MDKPELVAIGQFCLGGVLSFYENLLANDDKQIFDKKIILLNAKDQIYSTPSLNFPDSKYNVFDFSYEENPADYATRLEKFISDKEGVILTNFLPELASLHLFRKQKKTIFYICHDELYFDYAVMYSFLIDKYITHNPAMYYSLKKMLPKRITDIHYIPYGIEPSKVKKEKRKPEFLNLIFLGRHVLSKGIEDIPKINRILIEKKIPIRWTIFGDGRDTKLFRNEMKEFDNVIFKRYGIKEELFENLKDKDLMIHPSYLDGLPVGILESMSAGVVPILYEFNTGISKIIKDRTGVVVQSGNYIAIANAIISFFNDEEALLEYSKNAISLIQKEYNVHIQASKYYELFQNFHQFKKPRKRKFINYYKGWSSHPLMPLMAKKLVRKFKSIKTN